VVVNINETTDFEVDLASVGKEVEVYTITGKDVKAVNVEGDEQVGVKESKWDGQGKYMFAKHSMTLLRWSTGKKITEVVQVDKVRLNTRKLAWSA
jgi:alpha-N-arabinofuranosidase